MRYRKGQIEVNQRSDLPLLRQVIHSQFISYSQLLAFMNLGQYESRRRSFNWRLTRLVEHGLVMRHTVPSISNDPLYTITKSGIACLERYGEFYPAVSPVSKKEIEEFNVVHTLELNEVHLALLRADGILVSWTSEVKIRSSYLLGVPGYVKEYDAIIEVWMGEGSVRFGLEYERNQKRINDYLRVRELIEAERNVNILLYLAPSHDLLASIARFFVGSKRHIYFGLLREFKEQLLEANVSDTRRISSFPLRQVLGQM